MHCEAGAATSPTGPADGDAAAVYAALFDLLPLPVFYKDTDGRYRGVNRAFEQYTGRPRDQLLGKTFADIQPYGLARDCAATDPLQLARHGVQQHAYQMVSADGELRDIVASRRVVADANGAPLGVVGVIQDLTGRKRDEAVLAERAWAFRSLAESSPDYIARFDHAGRLCYCNSALKRYLDLPDPRAALGKRPGDIWPDGRFDRIEEAAAQAARDNATATVEFCEPLASGDVRYHQIHVVPERGDSGDVVGTIAFGRDVTAIRATERRLAHFIDNLPGLVYTYRRNRNGEESFPFLSPAVREIYGIDPGETEVPADEVRRFAHPDDQDGIEAAIQESARTLSPFRYEFRVCRPGHPERWMYTRSMPERDLDGSIVWHGLMLDITERKHVEDALRRREQTLKEALAFTEGVINAIPDLLFEVDGEGRYLNLWTRTPELLAAPKEVLLGKRVSDVLPPAAAAIAMQSIEQAAEHGVSYGMVMEIEIPAGAAWFELSVSKRSAGPDGEARYLVLSRDVTERRRMEATLALREREFRTLVEHSSDAVARYAPDLRRLYVNPAFAAVFGAEAAELAGAIAQVPAHGAGEAYAQNLAAVFSSGQETEFELRTVAADGRELCGLVRMTPEFGKDGGVESVLMVARDISELHAVRQKIHQMAFYDGLTGLPNRALFNERLRQMMVDAARHGQQAGVMMLDMDRFKAINDSMGHAVGDELLRQTAERLAACLRPYDTVARLGGDEFALLLPEVREGADLGRIASKLLGAFNPRFMLDGHEVYVSCSIGVALYPDDGTDSIDLLKFADSAMYHAKQSGRNAFRFYSRELTDSAHEKLRLESDLRRAVEHGELELHYQPKVSLHNGHIVGSEALIRWRHPQRGMVPPDQFIGIAEDSGQIVDLGRWVLREACTTAAEWNAPGLPLHKVAINLSARQFQSGALVASVAAILAETGCSAQWIELEITESLLLDEDGKTLEALTELRNMGVSIAIDDFGTGYSALSYLARFPIDTLKIDKSFIQSISAGSYRAELVRAILSIAHALKQDVVAEGVETVEQAAFLEAHGCRMAQGYLFSKALPKREAAALPRYFGSSPSRA